jgi:hypothetical protein
MFPIGAFACTSFRVVVHVHDVPFPFNMSYLPEL